MRCARGVAHSKRVTGWIADRTEYLAPVVLYPGEYEMQSLALGAYDVLRGAEQVKVLEPAYQEAHA